MVFCVSPFSHPQICIVTMAINCFSSKITPPIFNTHCQHSVSMTPEMVLKLLSISCSICKTVRVIILKQNTYHTVLLLISLQRLQGCCIEWRWSLHMEESDSEPWISVSVTSSFPLPSSPWVGVRMIYPRSEIVWHLLASRPIDTDIWGFPKKMISLLSEAASKAASDDPCFLVFMPLYTLFSLSMGWI